MRPVQVGNYVIDGEIGRGGMGQVYAATHRVLGTRAAIKTLLPDLSMERAQLERFFDEARATRAIRHPGIVEIYDVGVDGTTAYIAMELLTGESLGARLRGGPLPVRTAALLAAKIADVLAAAHALGIVHRDLKPDNVFLTHDGELKLLDFGVAKLLATDARRVRTVTGAMVGTVPYMSPEQCAGASDVDHRADLYALGCVLFHMLGGRVPFAGESTLVVANMHLAVPAPDVRELRPAVSAPLAAIVARLLAKAPADRFPSARAVALALEPPEVAAPAVGGVPTADAPAALLATLPSPPAASAASPPGHAERPRTGPTAPDRAASDRAGVASTVAASEAVPEGARRAPRALTWRVPVAILLGAGAIAAAMIVTRRGPEPRRDPVVATAGDAAPREATFDAAIAPRAPDAAVARAPAVDAALPRDPAARLRYPDARPDAPLASAQAELDALRKRNGGPPAAYADEVDVGVFTAEVKRLARAGRCRGLEAYLEMFTREMLRAPEGYDAALALIACERAAGRFAWTTTSGVDIDALAAGPPEVFLAWCLDYETTAPVRHDVKVTPMCAVAACRTGHVYWAREFLADFAPGISRRDHVADVCTRAGLDLDRWDR